MAPDADSTGRMVGDSVEGSEMEDTRDAELAVQAYVREIQQSRSISNQLRIGLLESDNATQTDVSEVLEIKELTSVMQTATQSLDILKKDVVFQKNMLQVDYEQRIEARALELYSRMNDTIRDLEEVHKKKISTLRKSFQKQLIDALAVIRSKYENHYNQSSGILNSHETHTADSARIQALQRKIDEKDNLIQSLEAQLAELEENEQPKQIVFQPEDDLEKGKLLVENQELREEAAVMQDRVLQLETALKEKIQHIHSLDLDVGSMKTRIEEDQRTIEKLSLAQEQLKIELANEKSSATTLLQQQKQDMENVLRSKLEETEKKQSQVQREHEQNLMGEIEKQKQQLTLQAEQLKEMKEKSKSPKLEVDNIHADKEKLLTQIKNLLSVKEEDAKTIERLQRELERINKTWEKKFDILKQSFHAMKDEMFLRQSLHRQAVNLHRVSVSYMTDGAVCTDLPVRSNSYLPSLPLPQIGVKPSASMQLSELPANFLDASEQDGFTEDELQVVSDTEDDMVGVPPLPPPPSDRMKENEVINL
ncbi:uncharacterized protein C10orf67 homolog, mitochondrial [Pseudophryne corroboree]|uniref:uncharacterized protein C10orf67 homolog, mitochondrial n=1 Tax=Pseudophryne corroboree TaxID=495146 RepID=UPI003081C1ED